MLKQHDVHRQKGETVLIIMFGCPVEKMLKTDMSKYHVCGSLRCACTNYCGTGGEAEYSQSEGLL